MTGCCQTRINGGFWGSYIKLLQDVVMPYQWSALNDHIPDAEKSHAIRNMRIAAGQQEGEFGGFVFQDSDLYKWLEAAGYILAEKCDPLLKERADSVIDLMEQAQQNDGYLNTYFIINVLDKRFTNLCDCHELYCLGHLIEAAVAYHAATGNKKILDIACRFADLAYKTFGAEEGKQSGYPGHQEIELALVKLYKATGENRYLHLAAYFINERGKEPNFFISEWEKRGQTGFWNPHSKARPNPAYHQAHKPVREQNAAVGHAVRAVYMYTGMAAVARETSDKDLFSACEALFNNITEKQMYITGGIGQTHIGEAFTGDYDLPGNTAYSETCAAIGLIFFAYEMFKARRSSAYTDTIETALYNTVIAGMAMDGMHFNYVNPLEVWPHACETNPGLKHVTPVRQKWFGCSCCPPNIARLLASLGGYIYLFDEDTIYINLYIDSEASFEIGSDVLKLRQETQYPSDETSVITVESGGMEVTIALRLPGWCKAPSVSVNGKVLSTDNAVNGYLYITHVWKQGDVISVKLPMAVRFVGAHSEVRACAGKTAVTRGPLVYCLEEADNGTNLSALSVCTNRPAVYVKSDVLHGVAGFIKAEGFSEHCCGPFLYHDLSHEAVPVELTFIPYYAWGNRGVNEMTVWVRYALE